MSALTWLNIDDSPEHFPDVDSALNDPEGLLAAGGDLSPARLLTAYRCGIFPWYSQGQPILWWSPNPRTVLFPTEFKASRSLEKTARNKGFQLSIDQDFSGVMEGCADPELRTTGTWITADMQSAYLELHRLGHAHSIEVRLNHLLVGGLYGVRLGNIFFGESMFSRTSDASKIALKTLCEGILGYTPILIDCQMATAHLQSLGARNVPRAEFIKLLNKHLG